MTSSSEDVAMMVDATPMKVPRIQISMTKAQEPSTKDDDNDEKGDDDSEEEMEYEARETMIHRHTKHHISPTPQKTKPEALKNDLTTSVLESLRDRKLNFALNEECTSLTMAPSGHFLLAGFSDGTLRIFDMTRGFGQENLNDAYAPSRNKSSMMVASKHFQKYGAVACQIHARGVHTDLLMDVDVAQDGQYCFAGVQRGSTELHAVHLGDLEAACTSSAPKKNLLDYVQVHVHSDAKLKGFGACSRVVSKNGLHRPKYLLLTGKAIKNIHIWSFEPPHQGKPAVWQQLYDTQTNGNTISLLSFCVTESSQKLLAVSKSDNQKLRLWDLSHEQEEQTKPRPKRPSYKDVKNSESALGVAGGFCVCGGEMMYNQMSIVSLDHPDNLYNHTELALPAAERDAPALAFDDAASRLNRRRRPQRGDLKQVNNVASVPGDASHVLLELDDGSMVQYTTAGEDTRLELVSTEETGIAALPAEFYSRTMCLANMFSKAVVASISLYNPNTGRGSLEVRPLSWITPPPRKIMNVSPEPLMPKVVVQRTPSPAPLMPKVAVQRTLSSPRAADRTAIQDCVQAPPASAIRRTTTVESQSTASDHTSPSSLSSLTPHGGVQLFSTTDASIETPRQPAKKTLSMVPDSAVQASASVPPGPTTEETRNVEGLAQVSPEQRSSEKTPADAVVKRGGAITKYLKRYGESECHPKKTLESQFEKLKASAIPNMQKGSKRQKERNNVDMPATENDGISKLTASSFDSSFLKESKKIPQSVPRKKLRRDEKVPPVEASVQGVTPLEKSDTASSSQLVDQASEKEQMVSKAVMKEAEFLSVVSSDQTLDQKEPLADAKKAKEANRIPKTKKLLAKSSSQLVDQASEKEQMVSKAVMKEAEFLSVVSSDQTLDQKEPLADAKEANRIPKTKKLLAKSGQPGGPSQPQGRPLPKITKGQVLEENQLEREILVKRQKKLKSRRLSNSSTSPIEGKSRQSAGNGASGGAPKDGKVKAGHDNIHVVASALIGLKSPPPKSKTIRKSFLQTASETNSKSATSEERTSQKRPRSTEAIFEETVARQYRRLRMLLKGLPKSNVASRVKLPTGDSLDTLQEAERGRMAAEHRAAHEMIRKRLLQSAETTLRYLVESSITVDEAKSDLKGAIQSYQEIVYTILHRQELEARTLATQQTYKRRGIQAPVLEISFPYHSTFSKVQSIVDAIGNACKRPVGRPKSILVN